jgi:NADPH:quinone reductase-like Zn-dependent oxidoreductase
MKAAVRDRFGAPADVVELRELPKPVPEQGEVLVRVRAASVNIADWYSVVGRPLIARPTTGLSGPRSNRLGTDYAGVVEALGPGVTEFSPGDEVFGGKDGAYAEYLCARVDRSITPKPVNVTPEEAAAVPVAGLTALQALRDKGQLQPGQKVVINGASGGVGTYAVQIAKALGGVVTAVCSTGKVETARSLGADRVVDYTQEDFTRDNERYDLLIDIAGTRSWREYARVLTPHATAVVVGGSRSNRFLGPLGHAVGMRARSLFGGRKTAFFIAKFSKADMQTLRELVESGKVRSVIDRRFAFDQVADALTHQGEGHPDGKVVIDVSNA